MDGAGSGAQWVSLAERLPTDGEVVYVRKLYATRDRRVTFLAKPVEQWVELNATYQLTYFAFWRPMDGRGRDEPGII